MELSKFPHGIKDFFDFSGELALKDYLCYTMKYAHLLTDRDCEGLSETSQEMKRVMSQLKDLAKDRQMRFREEARAKTTHVEASIRHTGWEEGHQIGLKEGHEAGLKKGREAGLKKGHEAGLKKGHEAGLKKGHEAGLKKGHQAGLKKGHQAGLKKGHQAGLKKGHQAGLKKGVKLSAKRALGSLS